MAKWYYYEKGNYYSPFCRTKSVLTHFTNTQDAVSFVNQNGGHLYSNGCIVEQDTKEPSNICKDIPSGFYRYEWSNPDDPARIIPMSVREDSYVEIMESLSKLDLEIERFKINKPLYDSTKSLFKLGVLMFGPPGTGKSCKIRDICRKHDAIVIYLDSVPQVNFLERLNDDTKDQLKIFVFEEVVSCMDDSNSLRRMLEFLDGSYSVSNSITLMSTNYPEDIPENIVRNGRIDHFCHVGYPNETARATLIKFYLGREANQNEINLTKNLPIVDIRHICFQSKKTGESFEKCVNMIEDKNKMIKKHFGSTKEIKIL